MSNFLTKENKALLAELVRTDFKLRYQGSLLGYVWSLLKPLLLFGILYVVFVNFLRVGNEIQHFAVYLLIGIVLWNFFTEMTVQSVGAIVSRSDLIRKIKIPRWTVVISTSISATINLLLSLVIVAIFMVVNQVPLTLAGVLLFPVYVIGLYLLALGFSFLLSALYVKFRDVSYIWEVILQGGFYATPIIYPLQMVKNELLEKLLLLNPIALVIQGVRDAIIGDKTLSFFDLWHNPLAIVVPVGFTLVVLVGGWLYFQKESKFFAENL